MATEDKLPSLMYKDITPPHHIWTAPTSVLTAHHVHWDVDLMTKAHLARLLPPKRYLHKSLSDADLNAPGASELALWGINVGGIIWVS